MTTGRKNEDGGGGSGDSSSSEGNPFQSPTPKGNPYTPKKARNKGTATSFATPSSTAKFSDDDDDDDDDYENNDENDGNVMNSGALAIAIEEPATWEALLGSFSFGVGELVGNHTMLRTHRSIERAEADTIGESHRKVEAHLTESRDAAIRQLGEVREKLEAQLTQQQDRFDDAQATALERVRELEERHSSDIAAAQKRFSSDQESARRRFDDEKQQLKRSFEDRVAKVRSELQTEKAEAV